MFEKEDAQVIEKHITRHAKRGNRSYMRVIEITRNNFGRNKVTELPAEVQVELLKTLGIEVCVVVDNKFYQGEKEIAKNHVMVFLAQSVGGTPKTVEERFNQLPVPVQAQELQKIGIMMQSYLKVEGYINHSFTQLGIDTPTHLKNTTSRITPKSGNKMGNNIQIPESVNAQRVMEQQQARMERESKMQQMGLRPYVR